MAFYSTYIDITALFPITHIFNISDINLSYPFLKVVLTIVFHVY